MLILRVDIIAIEGTSGYQTGSNINSDMSLNLQSADGSMSNIPDQSGYVITLILTLQI